MSKVLVELLPHGTRVEYTFDQETESCSAWSQTPDGVRTQIVRNDWSPQAIVSYVLQNRERFLTV